MNERETWRKLHLEESIRVFCIPISSSGHTHTHSHTLTGTHKYATDISMGKSPESDEALRPCKNLGLVEKWKPGIPLS